MFVMEKNPQTNQNQTMKHSLTQQKSQELLQLTGSQINLTSRSQKSAPRSPTSACLWKSRPCSAFPCYDPYVECKSKWKRPLSADNELTACRMSKNSSDTFRSSLLRCSAVEGEPTAVEEDPNFRHCYTYMSANLLRSLIRNPWNSDCSESASNSSELSHSEKSLSCLIREMAQENSNDSVQEKREFASNCCKDSFQLRDNEPSVTKVKSESALYRQTDVDKTIHPAIEKYKKTDGDKEKTYEVRDLKFQRWFQQPNKDEKIVRFSQEKTENDKAKVRDHEDRVADIRKSLEYNPENFTTSKASASKDDESSCSTVLTENEDSDVKGDYETFKVDAIDDMCHYKTESPETTDSSKKNLESAGTCSDDCPFSCCKTPETSKFCPEREVQVLMPEKEVVAVEKEENEFLTENNLENLETAIKDSTYDEIVTIINVLEQEDTNSLLNKDVKEDAKVDVNKKNDQLQDIYSYLDEVEKSSEETINVAKNNLESVRTNTQSVLACATSIPRLEELLNKNTLELAHEVLSLKIQIEDQSSGIKLLQNTIADMKEAAKSAKNSHDDEIFKVTNDAELTVQRHQKFIKQLLQEKKTLNEKVGKLVEDLKTGEERYQRNLKTIEERHAIEIQRVKETQAVAEKLKREKWIDMKTQKIKEMTVKGLEPELSRMAARQQQEMTDLRNLHRSELEAVELRATRRTTELLEQLRSELSKDKEESILKETNALRAKLEKQFEDERSKLEHELRKLREERRREKEILESKEAQMQDTYTEMKRALGREKERERQKIIQEHQEQMEALKRRHQNEIKSVRDTLDIEKEAWMNNFKKQQNAKFLEREAELHHQYKRERDRDIELVIERLENEASKAQQELNQTYENKLKRMKEKFDEEIKEMEATEATLKAKLSDAKAELLRKDDELAELNSQIHHLQSDTSHLRKLCEEMSSERANLSQIIGKEFEARLAQAEKEQEDLKNEIANLKTNHILELAKKDQLAIQAKAEAQQELNQVYNRVKITVSKKEEALEVLRKQHKTVLERCSHLEQMLENQRRNLLLK